MEKNNKNINFSELFNSKTFVISIIAIASLVLLLLVFRLGVFVGFEKAKFSYTWNDNYSKNFGGPRDLNMPPFPRGGESMMGMMDSRGLFGEIIKVDSTSLTIKDKDGVEKIVVVSDNTIIREFKKDLKISDLKVDGKIVVIGEPNSSGQIEAKLIRTLPDLVPTLKSK